MSFLNVGVLGWVAGIAAGRKMRHSGRGFLRCLWGKRDDSSSFWNLDSAVDFGLWVVLSSFCQLLWTVMPGVLSDSVLAACHCLVAQEPSQDIGHSCLLYLAHSGILECFLSSRFIPEESLPYHLSHFLLPSLTLSIHLTLFIYSVVF